MYLFRNILKILTALTCFCLVIFFLLDGCGGMSEGEDEDVRRTDDRRGRGRYENNDDGTLDRGRGRDDGDGDSDRHHPKGEGERTEIESEMITPVDQTIDSDMVDLLFIINTSKSNRKYIEKSVLQQKLGDLIPSLNNEGIDWRIFTTCGDTDEDNPIYNGKLHEIENDGDVIPFYYLENHTLDSYNASDPEDFTSKRFIDTISHDTSQRAYCNFPPFCSHTEKENRPLKALSGFIDNNRRFQYLREGADLVVIIISNRDEQPSQTKPKKSQHPSEVFDQFKSSFPDKSLFAIDFVINPIDKSCQKADKKSEGSELISLLPLITKGSNNSICSDHYSQIIIDLIREKQGKEVTRRQPSSIRSVESPQPQLIRSYMYGDNIESR